MTTDIFSNACYGFTLEESTPKYFPGDSERSDCVMCSGVTHNGIPATIVMRKGVVDAFLRMAEEHVPVNEYGKGNFYGVQLRVRGDLNRSKKDGSRYLNVARIVSVSPAAPKAVSGPANQAVTEPVMTPVEEKF